VPAHRPSRPRCRRPGPWWDPPTRLAAMGVLEGVYLTLLVLASLVIVWFSVFVVYRLFRGQR